MPRGRPVLDQILGALVRQIVASLQDECLEHQHVIERRASAPCSSQGQAFRAVRARQRPLQIRPKQFEIDYCAQPLQACRLLAESSLNRSSMSKNPA